MAAIHIAIENILRAAASEGAVADAPPPEAGAAFVEPLRLCFSMCQAPTPPTAIAVVR